MKVNRDILDNLCINITDGEHASVQNDDEGKYFLLSNKNIINGRIIVTENERKISKETFNKINKRIAYKLFFFMYKGISFSVNEAGFVLTFSSNTCATSCTGIGESTVTSFPRSGS